MVPFFLFLGKGSPSSSSNHFPMAGHLRRGYGLGFVVPSGGIRQAQVCGSDLRLVKSRALLLAVGFLLAFLNVGVVFQERNMRNTGTAIGCSLRGAT